MDLNANTVGQKISQSLGMVGKTPKDSEAMTPLVKTKLVAMGKLPDDMLEDAVGGSFLDSDAFHDVGSKLADALALADGWVDILHARLNQRGMETRQMNRTSAKYTPQQWDAIKAEFAQYFNIDVEADHTYTITLKA